MSLASGAVDVGRRRVLLRALSSTTVLALPVAWTGCGGGSGGGSGGAPLGRLGQLGPLQPPDALGLELPAGFTARVVARSGAAGPGGHVWHNAPDGGATFALPGGGWVYVSNSEVAGGGGGVGALRFDAAGSLIDQYSILSGTQLNCAGGATPWGTWLSCEEANDGQVWECDPAQAGQGVLRAALGRFAHEAAAVDLPRRHVYLTEDRPDGRLYRFVPSAADWPAGAARPALQQGVLQVLVAQAALPASGDLTRVVRVRWKDVARPDLPQSTVRDLEATAFNGGEGMWCQDGVLLFATKGDNRVWRYDCVASTLSVVYDDNAGAGELTGVDNIVVSLAGEVVVAEDGGNMEIRAVGSQGASFALVRVNGQAGSEITGPAFSPDGRHLYFSSQRGPGAAGNNGLTYAVSGPFFT